MRLSLFQQRLLKVLYFLLVINFVGLLLRLLLFLGVKFAWLAFIERAHVSFYLELLGVNYSHTVISGFPVIVINNHALVIGEACTSVRSVMLLLALVLATPSTVHKKFLSLLLLPVVYLFNILRLLFLSLIIVIAPVLFDLFHLFLWREGLSLVIVGLWFLWFKFL